LLSPLVAQTYKVTVKSIPVMVNGSKKLINFDFNKGRGIWYSIRLAANLLIHHTLAKNGFNLLVSGGYIQYF